MPSSIKTLSLLGLLCTAAACTPQEMPTAGDGAAFYAANCTSCHGATGRGDGPLAAGLNPQPADLTMRVMPQFGGAMADDLVPVDVDGVMTPTPRALAALLAYLESIQR